MIVFHTAEGSYYLSENSSLVVPLPIDRSCDYGSENHTFYTAMKVCRDNDIPIKTVQISGKHLFMLTLWSADFPTPNMYTDHQKAVYYTGDLANFIIYNYANWLVA